MKHAKTILRWLAGAVVCLLVIYLVGTGSPPRVDVLAVGCLFVSVWCSGVVRAYSRGLVLREVFAADETEVRS